MSERLFTPTLAIERVKRENPQVKKLKVECTYQKYVEEKKILSTDIDVGEVAQHYITFIDALLKESCTQKESRLTHAEEGNIAKDWYMERVNLKEAEFVQMTFCNGVLNTYAKDVFGNPLGKAIVLDALALTLEAYRQNGWGEILYRVMNDKAVGEIVEIWFFIRGLGTVTSTPGEEIRRFW